jgi:Helicase conserved C-terminal domain
MRILTLDNIHYDLDHLPEEVDDMRFAILDNSNPQEPDYHFIPLIFLESFNAPALVTRVNETGNTLVLVDRTECGRQLVARLGDKAVFVSGATKGSKRQAEYDEVADATDKIIVATYGVAAVGINIPRIFNLVLVEPGKSFVRVIQSIGRGIRKAEDKDFVQIWDVTSIANCIFLFISQGEKSVYPNPRKSGI